MNQNCLACSQLVRLFVTMQKNVGMDNGVAEDRLWDYYGREKHHRPDITCEGPRGERVIEDVLLRWGRVATLHEKKDASKVETEAGESFKRGEYTEAMARQEGDDRFMPLAFAARTGAWGQAAKNLWNEMMTMAKAKGIGADRIVGVERNDVGAPL